MLGLLVRQARRARLAPRETPAQPVRRGRRVTPEPRAFKARRGTRVTPERLDPRVTRELLARLGLPAASGLKDPRVTWVLKAQPDLLERLAHKDLKELPGQLALWEQPEPQAPQPT